MQLVDIVIVAIIFLVCGVTVTAVASIFLRTPYVPTPKKVAQAMVAMANINSSDTIYDLGAGDGRLLIEAAKQYPGISAKGSELSPLVCLWGKMKIALSGHKVTLKMKNLFAEDLSDADCVFLYLMPGLMNQLLEKFQNELRPGTTIISYAFPLAGHTPLKTEVVPWIQGKKKILLYKWS